MAPKRGKRHNRVEASSEGSNMGVDRLSDLPDPIIHDILSFVPTRDVVRMSILSRRWRHVWLAVPVLYFCDADSGGLDDERNKFIKFVKRYLIKRRKHMQRQGNLLNSKFVSITRFKFDIYCTPKFESLRPWLDYYVAKELEFYDRANTALFDENFNFTPVDLIRSESLTHVKLYGVSICYTTLRVFSSLISLSLVKVEVDFIILNDILLESDRSLEKLCLTECIELEGSTIFGSSLKFLEIVSGPHYEIYEVKAKNLQSFRFDGGPDYSGLILEPCGTLRKLALSNVIFSDQWQEDVIPRLPLLESLSLCNSEFGHLKIQNERLECLVLRGNRIHCASETTAETTIETPKLVSFSFEGNLLPNFSMVEPNIIEANIGLHKPVSYDTHWYFNLLGLLINLDCSKNVSLHIFSEEALIFPRQFRRVCRSPLPTLQHMKIRTDCPVLSESDLRDALLWLSPSLKTLLIEQNI